MKKKYATKTAILLTGLIMTHCLFGIPVAAASSEHDDPWDGTIVSDYHVTYSEQDAVRYQALYQASYELADDLWKEPLESLAEFAKDLQDTGDSYPIRYDVPDPNDIPLSEAVAIAYAWLEQQYGLGDEELSRFFPKISFFTNTQDDRRLWCVSFTLLADFTDDFEKYGGYLVYILSPDGTIVRSNTAEDAVG